MSVQRDQRLSPLLQKLPAWAVCPSCCRPYRGGACPFCEPSELLAAPGGREASRRPNELAGRASGQPGPRAGRPERAEAVQHGLHVNNSELGGLALGALGLVPLLGLVFCVLGAVLATAALRSARVTGRSPRLAYLALAVSLTTAVPGILLWGWLHAAAAAW